MHSTHGARGAQAALCGAEERAARAESEASRHQLEAGKLRGELGRVRGALRSQRDQWEQQVRGGRRWADSQATARADGVCTRWPRIPSARHGKVLTWQG